MKNNSYLTSLLAILIFAMTTVSCKKENVEPEALENTTWLLTKEIAYFPNGNLEISTRNSVWTFSSNQKLKILNPDSYINEERGEWNRTSGNELIININNDELWKYTRNYLIITETDSFMRIDIENPNLESSNGKASKIHYELIKL